MMYGAGEIFKATVPIYVHTGSGFPTATHFGAEPIPSASNGTGGHRIDTVIVEILFPVSQAGRRALEIKLHNDVYPVFYWQCSVNEEEFHTLRREQNLLVDFSNFPYKLVDFLQQCLARAPESRPYFTANLHVPSEDVSLSRNTGALLTIVEATSFKQINHLTLRFPPVPESVLNRHFQNIVKDLTEERERARQRSHSPSRPCYPTTTERVDFTRQPSMPFMPDRPDPGGSPLERENHQLRSRITALEDEVAELRKKYSSRPTNHEYVPTYDINKANEIIRRLQDEIQSRKAREKSARNEAKHMEKVLKDSRTESLRSELDEARKQLSEQSRALYEAQSERDRLKTELDETKAQLEMGNWMVDHLMKQKNENPLPRNYGEEGAFTFPDYMTPFEEAIRLSPDTMLGKAKVPEPPSVSSSLSPEY